MTYTEDVYRGRLAIMAEIERLQTLDEPTEDVFYRDPLCVNTMVVKKIVLSTGGPEDGFKLYFDSVRSANGAPDLDLAYGMYYRAEWGAYAESNLSSEEAQAVYDFYLGGYAEVA